MITETARYGHAAALLLVDVDRFKAINDTHGHLAGDRVLVEVAQVLTGALRLTDSAARIGGDELAVLLPHADIRRAQTAASRIVIAVRGLARIDHPSPITVSVSVGVSPITADTEIWRRSCMPPTALCTASSETAATERRLLAGRLPAAGQRPRRS